MFHQLWETRVVISQEYCHLFHFALRLMGCADQDSSSIFRSGRSDAASFNSP
jgi:hypothetical protein